MMPQLRSARRTAGAVLGVVVLSLAACAPDPAPPPVPEGVVATLAELLLASDEVRAGGEDVGTAQQQIRDLTDTADLAQRMIDSAVRDGETFAEAGMPIADSRTTILGWSRVPASGSAATGAVVVDAEVSTLVTSGDGLDTDDQSGWTDTHRITFVPDGTGWLVADAVVLPPPGHDGAGAP